MKMRNKDTILVVDDERGVRQSFNMLLKDSYHLLLAETGKEAMEVFKKNSVDLILLDIRLPDFENLELLEKLKEIDPYTEIIMVTAVNDVRTAVKAIKLGAYEYIVKPFDVDDVLTSIDRALEKRRLVRELAYLRNEVERYHLFEEMVGQDDGMRDVFKLISTFSQSDGTVLIQGESGTGKELVARAIHNRSPRKKDPFMVVNCAAIPSQLIESEIFGHNKGAFTGAITTRAGKLEIANRGTVFFDDIESMDINMQAKLLRVIQEKEFERIGSTKVINIDVRYLASSNKDLMNLISQNQFREDLYYRLNVLPVYLPPLRERREDIPLLLTYFFKLHAKKTGKPKKTISEEALETLKAYDWPGNVRELQNLVERMCTVIDEPVVQLDDIDLLPNRKPAIKDMALKDAVCAFERQYIGQVLKAVGSNRTKAAERLCVHRNTLLSKIQELGLDP